jgi:hypothetical protein
MQSSTNRANPEFEWCWTKTRAAQVMAASIIPNARRHRAEVPVAMRP